METPQDLVRWLYENPASPTCFSGAHRVLAEARKTYPKMTIGQVEKILHSIPSFTLHRPRRIRFKRLKTIPSGFMTDVQVDLADMQKLSNENDGMNYILVGADILSRRIFATPTKTKGSAHMIAAFKRLFQQMPDLPRIIFSDKGLEFQAGDVRKFFKNNAIQKYIAHSPDVKAAVAERFIRTLKTRLYKFLTHNNTKRWVDALPKIVNAINHSVSRITGMRPIDVTYENADKLWKKLYGRAFDEKETRYDLGDRVRIAKQRTPFDKGYLPMFSSELYKIDKVKKIRPNTYQLRRVTDDVPVVGKFYNEELSRTQERDKKLIIEKVIKSRTRRGVTEHFVKWKGLPEEANQWITEDDLL